MLIRHPERRRLVPTLLQGSLLFSVAASCACDPGQPRAASLGAATRLAESQGNQQTRKRPAERSSGSQAATAPTTAPGAGLTAYPNISRGDDGELAWPRPRFEARSDERTRLVERKLRRESAFRRGLDDEAVLEAMVNVPRHAFVPDHRQEEAYDDTPLPIGYGQTISQPYIVALMTDLLDVQPGEKILEVGTGSGYQSAVLTELTPFVFSIEIIKPLHEQAEKRYEQLGYPTIRLRSGDGYFGWKEEAPFDGVIVTCAAGHVPPPLWEQLKPGGRMVIPVGGVFETQRLLLLRKKADGSRESRSVMPVRFVPMTGRAQQAP